ncbi:MAG: hypothetical protein L3J10_07460 [Sulfurimonas sp.]|nr:hypothetical protein [Sulfurimonas sp.]
MKYILTILLFTFNGFAYDAFITPKELHASLNNDSLIILDVSSYSSYKKSHITGAIHLDINNFIDKGHSEEKFEISKAVQLQMKRVGITPTSRVVLYSKDKKSEYQNSCYVALLFTEYGFENISILDGGYMAWIFEYSFLVSSDKSYPKEKGTFKIKKKKNILISTNYLKKNLYSSQIIDSRENSKFYDKLGYIINANNYYFKDSFFDDSTLDYKKIEQNLILRYNLKRDKELIIYDDSVFNASITWYILYKNYGFNNIKVYKDDFIEWVYKKLPLTLPK